MTNLDSVQASYNKFETLSTIPYNIISYLISADDYMWKLISDDSATAWKSSNPNLTPEQKALLVYDGIRKINDCRVFMDTGADDAWLVESTMVRISVTEGIPNNYVWGSINIALEIYSHYKVNTMSNLTPRNLSIAQDLITILNGADISGIGRLYFDARATSRCRLFVVGSIPYKGISVMMSTRSLG